MTQKDLQLALAIRFLALGALEFLHFSRRAGRGAGALNGLNIGDPRLRFSCR
jgi:hypothetical protein